MRAFVRLPTPSYDQRDTRARARRREVSKFQTWQRWTPSTTVPLVKLVRLLTR